VILYLDAGQKGEFEIPTKDDPNEPDVPLEINGQVVQKTFTLLTQANAGGATPASGSEGTPPATEAAMASMEGMNPQTTPIPAPKTPEVTGQTCMAPVAPKEGTSPVIQVSNQEIKDGAIHLDKVVSDGLGWVVIWTQPQSGESEAIGSAQVQDGENQNVTVQVDASKATPQLVAILHLDGGQQGIFEPDKDCIVHVGVQMIQAGFSTMGEMAQATEAVGSDLKIVVQDQPLRGGNTIIIPEVVSDGPGWIGIHLTEPDGSVSHSAAIGAGHLDDGLNTNVVVRLTNPARATEKLWAMLHVDKGTLFEYEYPNPHVDTPVEVNGEALVAPFMITSGLPGQPVVIGVSPTGATPYLVDSQGFSLYTSTSDCKGPCLKEWLPFLATGQVETKEGVNSQKLRIVGLGDGNKQVTYDLLPLYYYIGDFKPGDTNGQGLDGKWFLAQP
jgi:predicted lipoprotein with Yx(FWY)xxD motif